MGGRKKWMGTWKALVLLIALITLGFAAPNEFIIRNIYDQASVSRHPDMVIEHIQAAKTAGYNSIISCDFELENLENNPTKVLANYQRVFAVAKAAGIKMIPWHFYQQQPAHENYSLAEAFPVKGTKFVVSGNKARAAGDHDIGFKNPGFEFFSGNKPDGWARVCMDDASCMIDTTVKKSGKASLHIKNAPDFARISQVIQLKPHRAYELSAWFKTSGLKSSLSRNIQFMVEPHMLYRRDRAFSTPKIWNLMAPTMNWRKCIIDFNSLENTVGRLGLFFSYRGGQPGDVWVDDIQIREVGLYETVRHRSKPIIVKSKDGKITYAEGADYVVDPRCNAPFTANSYWYEGHLAIPANSRISADQELRVDWYQYANTETQIPESDFCLPESWSTLSENVSHIDKLFAHQDAMFCNLDEWRVAGWNERCEMFKFQTAGDYMAKTMQNIETLLRGPVNNSGNGCRKIITVSDMFDPYHNADPVYGACKGGTRKSWEGLSDDVIILNWNIYKNRAFTKSSLKFFAGQDTLAPNLNCKQLLQTQNGYDANGWCDNLEELEKEGFDGVIGINWVTWYGDYSAIAATAAAYKARGRWPNNPFPEERCAPGESLYIPTGLSVASQKELSLTAVRLRAIPVGNHMQVINFSLPECAEIEISVFCPQGKKVRTLSNTAKSAGTHTINWNTKKLSAGIYFIRMSGEGVVRETLRQVIL